MENLSSLRLYRLNEGEINLYFVGQTKNGDWIGFRTKAIET
jgi:Nuclease A inhibitor-like protein